MVRSIEFGVMAEDMSSRDGEMERWGEDVCGSNRGEVNEISDEPSSVSFNLNVSEDSNRAGIDDNGLTLGLSALPLECPRLSWGSPCRLSGEPGLRTYGVDDFFVTMHQHVSTSGSRHLGDSTRIPVDNAADSSACWVVGERRRRKGGYVLFAGVADEEALGVHLLMGEWGVVSDWNWWRRACWSSSRERGG